MCANSSKCNLEFCQHFAASRDLEPLNFSSKIQSLHTFLFCINFQISEIHFLVLNDASKYGPFSNQIRKIKEISKR